MNKSQKTRILVSAAGTLASVSYIDHLKAKDYYVIGIDSKVDTVGKIICDEYHQSPLVSDTEQFISFIGGLNFDVYIPWLDEEHILFASDMKIPFRKKIITSPPESILLCVDKNKTYEFAKRNGINVAEKTDKVPAFIRKISSRGSKGARIVIDQQELDSLNKDKFIIQKILDGIEYTVDCLCDKAGNPIIIVPRERVFATNVSLISKISMDEEIISFCKNLLEKIVLRGPINIQLIREKNVLYLIEINPRLAGTSILTIQAGADILTESINDFLGIRSIKKFTVTNGLKMYRFYDEIFTL